MIRSEEEARAFTASLCDEAAMARLDQLTSLLIAENAQQNLIARGTIDSLWQRHIADSAQLLSYVSRETSGPWLDLGTGAGFPGLVVAAMRPEWTVHLIESRKRRVEWLERARDAMGLGRCVVEGDRLENVPTLSAGIISARAFAPMPRLIELAERFSTKQTVWLLPKGRSATQDLQSLSKNRRAMFHVKQSLTDADAGIIIGGPVQQHGRPEARQTS